MRVLLVSTYELGHQPLHVASPAAALRAAGHEARCLDLSVDPWDYALERWAEAVAFSVPMHTAMRLAVRAARPLRRRRPELPVCLYGLYAAMKSDTVVGAVADRVIAGEYEPGLVGWADEPAGVPSTGVRAPVQLGRHAFVVPARELLPPLERYAHLAVAGEERPVGYVEASHGCVHRCRHCPVPVVYDGRIRIVEEDVLLADIAQLVAMGARHITFGDPDFLNGRRHSLRVVRAMHERFPRLTFDCTAKVEHILENRQLWPELAACGCLFVVSAFESVNDDILERLDKGHVTREAVEALELLRGHGIEVRPSFLPFTPWTTLDDVVELLDFVAENRLIGSVDAVQYAIRLLVPEGSLLLEPAGSLPGLGAYDAELLTYTWRSPDPRVDALQRRIAALAEAGAAAGEPVSTTYLKIRTAALAAAERAGRPLAIPAGSTEGRPRLTEPWFC